ncbi:MAG: transglycosylase SLT domain-containing protein [Fibrobacterota bacterium]
MLQGITDKNYGLAGKIKDPEYRRMMEVSRNFESVFTSYMLKTMKNSVGIDKINGGKSVEKDFYNDMLFDEYASMMSGQGGTGLADQIFKSLARNTHGDKGEEKAAQILRSLGNKRGPQTKDISSTIRKRTESPAGVEKYREIIDDAAIKYGVDPVLIESVIINESGGRAYAVSRAGARGVMQLMDTTASDMGVENVYDPKQNIFGGAKYLSLMKKKFGGNEELMLAAYNAGPGNVEKYGGVPPFPETVRYIGKVLETKEMITGNRKQPG